MEIKEFIKKIFKVALGESQINFINQLIKNDEFNKMYYGPLYP